jgi:REP element-mobilizing transposase RayT
VKEDTSKTKPEFRHFYRRKLPHIRNESAIFFVTWRLNRNVTLLSERDREIVSSVLRYFDGKRYALIAYVVMDDHVHVIVEVIHPYQLHDILHSWKSYSARNLDKDQKRDGQVWQHEYWDRIIRDVEEFEHKINYIDNNPKKRWPGTKNYKWQFINSDYLV